MRVLVAVFITLSLLLPACKPKQTEEKPADIPTSNEAPKNESNESSVGSEEPIGDFGDFPVSPGGSSASSRR